MSFEKLKFTKDWRNKTDFPTYQSGEAQVRADLQLLHDETKTALNNVIENLTNEEGADSLKHSHENKAALDKIKAVTDTLGASPDAVPSEKAVNDALVSSGAIPAGGTVHQVLKKNSDNSYDMSWATQKAADVFYDPLYGSLPVSDMQSAFKKVESVMAPQWRMAVKNTAAGTYSYTVPENVSEIFAFIVGGGGSGAAWYGITPTDVDDMFSYGAQGGASGCVKKARFTVNPGDTFSYTVGKGGASVTVGGSALSEAASVKGNSGEESSFDDVSAPGGEGGNPERRRVYGDSGNAYNDYPAGPAGGIGSDARYTANRLSPHIGSIPMCKLMGNAPTMPSGYNGGSGENGTWQDMHELSFPFAWMEDFDLFPGGHVYADTCAANYRGGQTINKEVQTVRENAAMGIYAENANASAQSAFHPGGGGGGAVSYGKSNVRSAISGAGADGVVYIFEKHLLF